MTTMDNGTEDAAILLMSLGEESAAEVFKLLNPKEVQRLGETITQLRAVPHERVETVLKNFTDLARARQTLVPDASKYIRSVLRRALGDEKASVLLDRILQNNDISGIESLKWMDSEAIAELLRNEHPQIVAAILVHLESDHCSQVLKQFTDRHRNEVLIRIATLDGIQPSALRDLNEVMGNVLSMGESKRRNASGGPESVAEIINMMGSGVEASSLDYIREMDPDLAQKIQDSMLSFEDLLKVDDRGIQTVLREVQSESLVMALKGATQEMRDKIFRNMSSRAAETLREDLEGKGPVRVSEVEAEQKDILKIVRRLSDEGQIMLPTSGGDDGFV
ncbi:flagellar motor switch protein FliG [Amphibiibacter pelophylacis]